LDAHRNIITSISNDSIQDDIYDNFHQVRRPFSHIIQHNNTRKSLSSLTKNKGYTIKQSCVSRFFRQ